ncbi:MAG: HepT-like ribonuclease domain-containing protein, partial [Cyanobacteria bacterium P01_A01_bin.83]
MRKDVERMRDISEAISKIEKYAIQGQAKFLANELIQGWMLLQLQIIGEAARSMSVQTREQYPQINWQDIIDFRNLLVHEYFRVDLQVIWQIIEQEI